MIKQSAGFVRDIQPFSDARISCRELQRFVGIVLDLAMASRLEFKWFARRRIKATIFDTGVLPAKQVPMLESCQHLRVLANRRDRQSLAKPLAASPVGRD
jgi:hypothetical protein